MLWFSGMPLVENNYLSTNSYRILNIANTINYATGAPIRTSLRTSLLESNRQYNISTA